MSPTASPSLTVVIGTRNRAESVVRILGQVLAQGYEPLQVCVADDGSTDDTLARLATVADPRVLVIASPGQGANAARNAGAAHATGDYLVFLDDDDAVKPGWLRALMDLARDHDADLVSCAVERVDREWKNPIVDVPGRLGPIFSEMDAMFLGGAFAIRASLFHEVGGYPESLPSNQQTGLALRVATHHEQVPVRTAITPFVGVVWHQRRRGSGGVPASFARNRLEGTLALLEEYPERFARDGHERGNYLSAAATCAARLGDFRTARRLYWRAYRSWSARRRDVLRMALTWFPAVARRVWPVIWDDALDVAPPIPTLPRVVEVVQSIDGAAAVPTRAREEVRTLVDAGHRVTVVVNDAPTGALPINPERVLAVGPRLPLLRRSSLKPLVLGWRARRVVRDRQPDLVVSHHPVAAWVVRGEARRSGAHTVAVVHSLVHDEERRGASAHRPATALVGKVAERRLHRDDVVAPVSDALVNSLLGLGVRLGRIRPVANAVDTERFRPGAVPHDIDVLYVGRLSPEKGPQDLVAACVGLPPATRITIAGSGRLRPELEARAARLACRVDFTGFVTEDDLAALYRRARVVAVPSHSEAFGMVVLEAMASGTPVVAARVGGIPALVQPGTTGWLVEPGDVDALRATLAEALHSDLAAYGERARRSAAPYATDAFRARFTELVGTAADSR